MGQIVIGFLGAGLGFCIFAGLLACTGKFEEGKRVVIGFTFAIILGIAFGVMTYFCATNIKNIESQKFYASFQAKKQTYENSIDDERLTALERLQITENIMYINSNLAEKQVDVVQWYNFNLTQDNKNNILELAMIN
jgi:hypothetical protein